MDTLIDKETILRFLQNDKVSSLKTQARKGRQYYEGQHDIKDYQMFYYDADGELVHDIYRTNTKISHPFFKVLVQQCVEYLLGGRSDYVISQDPTLQDQLDNYFDDEMREEVKQLIISLQVDGWGYIYRYLAEDGKSKFEAAQGLNVIEISNKLSGDGRNYVIYHYDEKILNSDGEEITITRVELWTEHETYFYNVKDNEIELDKKRELNPRPHVIYLDNGERYQDSFGEIPFYRIDNDRRRSDLHIVKDMIDDYDLHSCSITNDLQDFSSAVYFVRGLQGEDDLDKLQRNLKSKKIAGLPNKESGIDVKTIEIPYEGRKAKMDENKQNIYHYGFGFNPSQTGDGNITNVVIRSRYGQLSLKCNLIESKLRTLMKRLIQIVLDEINSEFETGYTLADVEINFERSIVTNDLDDAEKEVREANAKKISVETLMNLTGLLGEQKVLELVGNVLEIDVSGIDLETIQQARIDLLARSNELMGETP